MHVLRFPAPPLDAFVDVLWYSRRPAPYAACEHMLPLGSCHLVIALHGEPITWSGPEENIRHSWRGGIVHGPQSRYYLAGPKPAGVVVGAAFRPGAAGAVLGVPAAELLDRHVTLDELWAAYGRVLHERLASMSDAESALAVLERALVQRLKTPLLMHPAVALALNAPGAEPVWRIRERTGYSHRHFIALFRSAVGLTPKHFYRIRRLSKAAQSLAARERSLADLAARLGYADQAHFTREFRELAGVAPLAYRPRAADSPHHHVVG